MVKFGVCRPKKHQITTHLFPYANIIDTVRLPLIWGEKTHPLHSQFEKKYGLENTVELPSIAG